MLCHAMPMSLLTKSLMVNRGTSSTTFALLAPV